MSEKCRKEYHNKKGGSGRLATVAKTPGTSKPPPRGRLRMLELFKGTGSVGKVAKKMGYEVVSLDLDPIFTPDIETDILRWDYKKFYNETGFLPNFIWASPPCNTYSQFEYYRGIERDKETGKPFTKRAKEGTDILYRTLDIISFFENLNPNLKFVVENPRGLMRNDLKIRKLMRETTKYCLYGDDKSKPTDFFSNFQISLKDANSLCPNKPTYVADTKSIEDRYRIPPRLIRTILTQSLRMTT